MYSARLYLSSQVPPPPVGLVTIYPTTSGWKQKDSNGVVTDFGGATQIYENILYSDLLILINTNALVDGRRYKITDYQTIYTINGDVTEMTGAIEPIIVLATSTNTLSPYAYSELNPFDTIIYDPTPTIGLRNSTANSKGIILHRYDNVHGNSYPADFRGMVVRRWNNGSGIFNVIANNGNTFQDYIIFTTNSYNNEIKSIDVNTYISNFSTSDNIPSIFLPTASTNNTINGSVYGVTFTNSVTNSNLLGVINNIYFGGLCSNCNLYGRVNSSNFNLDVTSLKQNERGTISLSSFGEVTESVIDTCISSTLGDIQNCNIVVANTNTTFPIIESNCIITNCTFGGDLNKAIGYQLDAITTGGNFTTVRFDNLVNINFIGSVSNTTFTDYSNSTIVTVGNGLNRCQFLGSLNQVNIGSNFTDNTFLCKIDNSTFGNDVSNNTFNGCVDTLTLDSLAINNTFNGDINTVTINSNTLIDNVFNSKIINSDLIGVDIQKNTFDIIENVTTSNLTLSTSKFCGILSNTSLNPPTLLTMSDIISNGNLDGLTISINGTLLNVIFISNCSGLTFTTISSDISNANIYSEIVYDSGDSNWKERYISLGNYVYTAI